MESEFFFLQSGFDCVIDDPPFEKGGRIDLGEGGMT